ncbi:hypothetical protein BD289DRAFT_458916 [Coniella lustricola]|uniref:DUF1750-domain-containing protein n=1 Tax=Coniella lustricola TaxID=2025994 RepID=A0A2T3AGZ7_9PEZI|nr:hypothetical protein BD289DRAFT_458916 [Coniella lustricola]
MADPSASIHEKMLLHLHLVSTFRYPERTTLSPHDPATLNWLLNMLLTAPKIARDQAPFYWTYLDAPRDGQIMLTWQPLQRLGTNFASDGYIWPSVDEYTRQDLKNGLVLEIFTQRIGFRPGESVAAHARTRFRLTPTPNHPGGAPQVDPSLWLVHYGPSQQPMPVDMLPIPAPMHQTMQNRIQLQRGGQIARKEFMLADRLNWPTISPPREGRGHHMLVQSGGHRNIPQQMAYPPAAKRSRTAAHVQHAAAGPASFVSYEDEEDTSTGDLFDHMTPRDVSMARYTRHHEWMDEVLGSAYRISQIEPADLGIGLQGELSSVTQGIFEAAGVDAHKKPTTKPVVGHLDPEVAEQFRTRVADKIREEQTEMARMKAQHEKELAKFKSISTLSRLEKELHEVVDETGSELWRLEGREEEDENNGHLSQAKSTRNIDDIVAEFDALVGRHSEIISDVRRVQDGGYQEPAPEPEAQPLTPALPAAAEVNTIPSNQLSRPPSNAGSQNSGVVVGDPDVAMGGTTGSHEQADSFSQPTPQTQPSLPEHSAVATDGSSTSIPAGGQPSAPATAPAHAPTEFSQDVPIAASTTAKDTSVAPDQGTGSGDWVVVPKGGVSPDASSSEAAAAATSTFIPAVPEPIQASDANKASDSGFDDMNTAGAALSSYDNQDDGDEGDSMDLGVEDSAFGDAVFGVEESRGSATETPADGL